MRPLDQWGSCDAYQQQALQDFGLVSKDLDVLKLASKMAVMDARFSGKWSDRDAQEWLEHTNSKVEQAHDAPKITPLQDPIDQGLLSQVVDEVKRRVSRIKNATIPERTIIASLPIGQMNAWTIHLPETEEYLILVQRGLFGLLNLLARAVSSVWPESAPGEGVPLMANREELARNLGELDDPGKYLIAVLEQALIRGNPSGFPLALQSPSRMAMKEALLINAEVFILAHEYGHIQRAHFNAAERVTVAFGNRELSATSRSHQQEFAADLTGFEYANSFGSLDPIEQYLAYCGTCFFLSCQDIVEEALLLLAGQNDAKRARDTHPTGAQRREAITAVLQYEIGRKNADLVARGFGEMHWILQEFWRMAKPRWAELGKSGAVASPVWAAAVESYDRSSRAGVFEEAPPDTTTKLLGMPSLREMEPFKLDAFSALLNLVDESSSERRRAAEWVQQNPHIVVFSLASEIAYGIPDRRDAFISYLLEKGPGLTHWVSMLQSDIRRHADNVDITGVTEVLRELTLGMEYLVEIARRTQAGETVDYLRLLFEIAHRVHQRMLAGSKDVGTAASGSPADTTS